MTQLIGNSVRTRAGLGCILALLAMASTALAKTAPRAASGPYRIAGRVVNGTTGEPVARATVAVLAEGDNHVVETVQSDADGGFSLVRLAAGKYPLTASKRGYRTAFYDEHDDFNSAIVTGEGQDTGNLLFRLVPSAVLRGVVTGDGGDPVEGANVMLFQRQRASTPSERSVEVDAAITDDTGAYEFGNLSAGEYRLAVTASPWFAVHGSGAGTEVSGQVAAPLDVTYPITFFDSTIDEASASPIILDGGKREEADINLHAVPALRLKVATPQKQGGIARPELRQMVFGVQVAAQSAGFIDSLRTGTVEFGGLAPGHYELTQGDPPRIVGVDATDSQEVDLNAGTPAVTITGILRVAGGAALPEASATLLEPLDGGNGRVQMSTMAHKGQFRFDAVAPGLWSIAAEGSGQVLPVISTSVGGVAAAGSQIAVRDRPLSVVVTVSRGGSRVQGFARRDGKGAAGVMVVLVPRQPTAYRALVRRDQSDSDGSFSLRDVPAGQYTVVAIEDGWKLDWQRREVVSRYLPGGVAVTINERSGAIVPLAGPVLVQAP